MQTLLEEFYKTDLHVDKFHDRKVYIEAKSYQINGISQSGKTKLIKNYLLSLKKNSYLYINCKDVRIDIGELNTHLAKYCIANKIDILALDNYTPDIKFVNASQLIISCEAHYETDILQTIQLYPLDYEEFLAYEHKYDSSALNHFFQLGGFAHMHKVHSDERNIYIQKTLQYTLNEMEFDILKLCAKMISQKVSAYTIYERLKNIRKISKDKLYKSYENLLSKNYIHNLKKYEHAKATKKLYLCDISLRNALTTDKHFGRLFENMVYLELLKSGVECFYEDGIDFYIPDADQVILCKPFTDERSLFKKMEEIEAFIFTHQVKKVTAITMNREGGISHPFSKVEMLPFDIWALGD
ncbi:MAG: ATP-binding protein [Campylobacterota bacterium]|nr:ATP-binding protein [Campylobacterota bacterium]